MSLGALVTIGFRIVDGEGGLDDRLPRRRSNRSVLGLVNLVAAEALNRAPPSDRLVRAMTPQGLPGIGQAERRCRVSCAFLGGGRSLRGRLDAQRVHWLVAATEYGALTAVYCAGPDLRTPGKAVTVVERGAFTHARGCVFLDRLPDLAGRRKSGPCAVHLETAFPSNRVALRSTGGRRSVHPRSGNAAP